MNAIKKTASLLLLISLTGCAQLTPTTPTKSYDYNIFCPDTPQKEDNQKRVVKVDDNIFYLTSDGKTYSYRELQNLSSPDTGFNKALNTFVPGLLQEQNKSDPSTAKKVIVNKFVFQSDKSKTFCSTGFVENGAQKLQDGKVFVLDTTDINLDTQGLYNNTERGSVKLYPVKN